MLIKIDPVLSPDLLFHLRSMGHGEKLILADANFPANTTNDKVRFGYGSGNGHDGVTIYGTDSSNTYNRCVMTFIRLGDSV